MSRSDATNDFAWVDGSEGLVFLCQVAADDGLRSTTEWKMPRGGAASTYEKPADGVERRARRELEIKLPMAQGLTRDACERHRWRGRGRPWRPTPDLARCRHNVAVMVSSFRLRELK